MRYASEKLSALFWQSVKCAGTFRHQIWTARSRCLGLKLTSNKNAYLCKFINEDNFYSDFKDFSKINLLFVIPSCTRERLLIRPVVSIFLFRYPQISTDRKRAKERERKRKKTRSPAYYAVCIFVDAWRGTGWTVINSRVECHPPLGSGPIYHALWIYADDDEARGW